ncbi:MAG: mandelate racemase/muconate lactonizing enzyme family protein [Promethearchaeota archaeon]|jgi:L-alanine-DL-glutamate epimerase-like enolase superfamily enzyme
MKITDIRATIVKGNFEWVLIKILTDNDEIYGLGESFMGPGVKELVLSEAGYGAKEDSRTWSLKHLLIGEDPTNVERLTRKIYVELMGVIGTTGTVSHVLSGVETALWDIAGKALGAPVYKLLGGKYRDKIRIYADCHAGESEEPETWARRAKEVKDKGFTALKFDVDTPAHRTVGYNRTLSNREIRLMTKQVEAVREAIGEEIDLGIDCHWKYNTNDAIRLANALEPYNLLWMEDPVPPENVDAMRKVTNSTKTPICTGENLYTRHGFRRLIETQAVDIISPDISKVGGLSESKKISDSADLYYMAVAPHNITSSIGTVAACHVCASIPNFLVLEYHAIDIPWWEKILERGEKLIQGGYMKVPEKPGIGVEINEKEIKKHLKEDEYPF